MRVDVEDGAAVGATAGSGHAGASPDAGRLPDAPPRRSLQRTRALPGEVREELTSEVGAGRAERVQERLADAARSYERDRYPDALRVLRRLAQVAPGAPAVRELHGLTLYRLGRWKDAARELEAFRHLTGSFDQHPTLADCYRALRRYEQVEELWDELRRASPSAELVTEGRIVAAGALADRGDLPAAIDLLAKAKVTTRRPRSHHLRLWYALADLYERAGDVPRARELFRRVAENEASLSDVTERLAALA